MNKKVHIFYFMISAVETWDQLIKILKIGKYWIATLLLCLFLFLVKFKRKK